MYSWPFVLYNHTDMKELLADIDRLRERAVRTWGLL